MTVNFTVAASVSFIVAARSFIVNVNVTDDVFFPSQVLMKVIVTLRELVLSIYPRYICLYIVINMPP